MRGQILRGLTMLMLTVALAFVSVVTPTNGQSRRVLVANIPFEFIVGNKALPQGTYIVQAVTPNSATLMIKSRDSRSASMRLTNGITAPKASAEAKLVFHRYGEIYFLSEVWTVGESSGRQLLKSSRERASERELAANAQGGYETVVILATLQ